MASIYTLKKASDSSKKKGITETIDLRKVYRKKRIKTKSN